MEASRRKLVDQLADSASFYTEGVSFYFNSDLRTLISSASMKSSPPRPSWRLAKRGGGLGLAALTYIGVDYLRHLSPALHAWLQPVLWALLALVAVVRIPFYKHWSVELRSALVFIGCMLFLLAALLLEMLSVRSVTAILGLDWHRDTPPLPDTGQWLLLALNEKLPETIVQILRARIVGLHHFLMLFVMLAFSVLFDCVKSPGLGLGARYMFTMGIGRLLRAISFGFTILPSPRPWCAASRFHVPAHPNHWAQKYYVPYASDFNAIRQLINQDIAYVDPGEYKKEYHPNWGSMSFLADFLRPFAYEGAWYNLLKKGGGGCNDLLFSGHMLVAVLTAMAWTEAYGGYSSGFIWILVLHSAQREVRERHHYSVDCIVAIYVGILMWRLTGFLWPIKDASRDRKLNKLEMIQGRLIQAAKEGDVDKVRNLLKGVELGSEGSQKKSTLMQLFAVGTIFFALVIVLMAFTLLNDG